MSVQLIEQLLAPVLIVSMRLLRYEHEHLQELAAAPAAPDNTPSEP